MARILQVARRGYVVEALDGVFEAPPTLDQVRALERLREHGGPFAGQALVRHVDGEPPASARLLGRLLPTVAQYREAPRILRGVVERHRRHPPEHVEPAAVT